MFKFIINFATNLKDYKIQNSDICHNLKIKVNIILAKIILNLENI